MLPVQFIGTAAGTDYDAVGLRPAGRLRLPGPFDLLGDGKGLRAAQRTLAVTGLQVLDVCKCCHFIPRASGQPRPVARSGRLPRCPVCQRDGNDPDVHRFTQCLAELGEDAHDFRLMPRSSRWRGRNCRYRCGRAAIVQVDTSNLSQLEYPGVRIDESAAGIATLLAAVRGARTAATHHAGRLEG